jgi:hypothetical protein
MACCLIDYAKGELYLYSVLRLVACRGRQQDNTFVIYFKHIVVTHLPTGLWNNTKFRADFSLSNGHIGVVLLDKGPIYTRTPTHLALNGGTMYFFDACNIGHIHMAKRTKIRINVLVFLSKSCWACANPQGGGSPFVDCPWLFIQYICSHPPYL